MEVRTQFTLSDLARITGAKPRSIQLWADAGVIRPAKSTQRAGSGTHRVFDRTEAMVACVIAFFAGRKVSIGGLVQVASQVRALAKLPGLSRGQVDVLETAASGKGSHWLAVYWVRKSGRLEVFAVMPV